MIVIVTLTGKKSVYTVLIHIYVIEVEIHVYLNFV